MKISLRKLLRAVARPRRIFQSEAFEVVKCVPVGKKLAVVWWDSWSVYFICKGKKAAQFLQRSVLDFRLKYLSPPGGTDFACGVFMRTICRCLAISLVIVQHGKARRNQQKVVNCLGRTWSDSSQTAWGPPNLPITFGGAAWCLCRGVCGVVFGPSEAPMTLHWLASDLGVHMAPMLRVSRSMNQQMKSRRWAEQPAPIKVSVARGCSQELSVSSQPHGPPAQTQLSEGGPRGPEGLWGFRGLSSQEREVVWRGCGCMQLRGRGVLGTLF